MLIYKFGDLGKLLCFERYLYKLNGWQLSMKLGVVELERLVELLQESRLRHVLLVCVLVVLSGSPYLSNFFNFPFELILNNKSLSGELKILLVTRN